MKKRDNERKKHYGTWFEIKKTNTRKIKKNRHSACNINIQKNEEKGNARERITGNENERNKEENKGEEE